MLRFRLGFLGALLLVLATLAAQIQPAPAGFGATLSGADETAWGPIYPAAGHAVASGVWDETDEDLDANRAASGTSVAPEQLRLIESGHPNAALARRRPRATGPPRL